MLFSCVSRHKRTVARAFTKLGDKFKYRISNIPIKFSVFRITFDSNRNFKLKKTVLTCFSKICVISRECQDIIEMSNTHYFVNDDMYRKVVKTSTDTEAEYAEVYQAVEGLGN